MKYTSLLRKIFVAALLLIGNNIGAQNLVFPTLPAGDSIIIISSVTISGGTSPISKQQIISGANFNNVSSNDPKTGASADPTLTDVFPIPTVSLSVSVNAGTEAGGTAITVTATSSAVLASNQTVTLGATGTNITAGDYTLSNTTITILSGQTTGTVTFTVVDDAVVEGTETATLTISNPSSGLTLGSPTTQDIVITDNDVAGTPTVSLSVSANAGSEASATVITVTATASAAVTGDQTVTVGATGTNITAGDYTLSNTTITILSGQTTGTVTFTVVDDAVVEGTETATLTISNPSSGLTLGSPTTQDIVITDNDVAGTPTVSLSVSANAGSEASATAITVTATASAAVTGDQTVTVGASGTNITAGDYTLSNTTITILSGQTTGTVTFTVVDDAVVEGTETSTLTISNPSSGLTLGSPTTQDIVITDNDVAITYFRSRQTGNWNDVNTWETATTSNFSSTITSPATSTPDNTSGAITIISPHVVTVTANVTTDETTINSGGSLVVDPNIVLTVNNGAGDDLTVNGTMTVRSTSAGTGSIGNSAGNITGNVTVERYISSANNRAYRLLGPSVNTTSNIHVNWQENATNRTHNPQPGYGTHITGTTVDQSNGFDATITGQGSLFTYNNASPAWVPAANTNVTTLDGKTGYLLYFRGDRTIDLDATGSPLPTTNSTLRATGTLLQGMQTYTGLGTAPNFSLVTNPYASSINWATIYGNNSANFENYYTYWDPNIGTRGGYVTVTNTGVVSPDPAIIPAPSPAGTIHLQTGQAFFVKPLAGTPSFVISESDKSSTNNIDVFRTASPAASKFTTSLYFNSAELGRRLADGVTSLYDPSFNKTLDGNDAEEINNWDENIAIARDGKNLSIEERSAITAKDTIFLAMNNMKQQGYEFDFNPTNLNPNMTAQLVDNYTGNKTVLNVIAKTTVPFNVNADAASSSSNRFYIAFSPSGALPVSLVNLKAFQKNTGVQVEWTTQQEINMERYEVERSQTGQAFTKVGSIQAKSNSSLVNNYSLIDANPFSGINYYKIKTVDKAGIVTYSQVVKVNVNKASSTITILSNPVKNNSVDLQFNDLPRGVYTIELTNKLGQQIARKVINHNGGTVKETIQPSNGFASGIYQLKVSGAQINITHQVIKN